MAPAQEADAAFLSVSDAGEVREPADAGHWRILSGVVLVGAACTMAVSFTSSPAAETGSLRAATQMDELGCGGVGDNCVQSKCCIAGGSKGLQCYSKNDDYAECQEVDACEPGVHEGEKNGEWDATGTFVLDAWKCGKVGKKSKPGCDSFTKKSECPSSHCAWNKDICRASCESLTGDGACWDSGYCMWNSGTCEQACWEFDQDTCAENDACMWSGGGNTSSCKLACHIHMDEAGCPHDDKCMWADYQCQPDPCSAQWEDCRETQCCSGARGAIGMACFSKNKDYASCMDRVDPEFQKDWDGKQLGNRTKFPAGCSWAGQECSETKACCNEGFNCATKDDTFAGCVQAMQVTTWVKQAVDLPEGWEGKVLGGWHGEYQIDPAPEGTDPAGTSLYCILAVLPDSGEVQLMEVAKRNNGSVFGCDAHSVYHSWKTDGAEWDTGETTVINTAVFLKVFKWMKEDGLYLQHDWTIKVDADCVFLPQRLREHMWALRPPADTAMYLKNNNLKGLGNDGFLGAIEVFSKRAMQIYLDNDDDCGKYLGEDSGEDGFLKGCMNALGVGFMMDAQMFEPNFDPVICTNGAHAAYHPIKYEQHWQRCWDLATGKICQGLTFDCGGDLDPPISSAGIR